MIKGQRATQYYMHPAQPTTVSLQLWSFQLHFEWEDKGTHIGTHMSGRNIWINFESLQLYIHYINPWKKCSDLMQFLRYLAEPFLRPLRPNEVWPLNFEVMTSKIFHFWKFGCQPQRGTAGLCMTKGSKVPIYLTLTFCLHHILTRHTVFFYDFNIEE